MPLRFVQILLPEDAKADLKELLEDREILGTWSDEGVPDRKVINLLVPAEEAEPIMDRLEHRHGGKEGFSVVLFPVEAVLPRPDADFEKPDKEDKKAETESNAKRVSREELYSDVVESFGMNRVFIAMTLLSAIVAAGGLIRDDVAVIIGAMVIAPLLGPNVAMSLSTTLGDMPLLRHALFVNAVGLVLALSVSIAIGVIFPIDPTIPAIATRTGLGLSDLALALAAGAAGTFAYTGGITGAVIGVMVAVALVPPLVVLGMLLGAGEFDLAFGAFLIVVANVVCINLAGVATFLLQGVRPRTWWEAERAKKATRKAIGIWLLMLVILTGVLYLTQT